MAERVNDHSESSSKGTDSGEAFEFQVGGQIYLIKVHGNDSSQNKSKSKKKVKKGGNLKNKAKKEKNKENDSQIHSTSLPEDSLENLEVSQEEQFKIKKHTFNAQLPISNTNYPIFPSAIRNIILKLYSALKQRNNQDFHSSYQNLRILSLMIIHDIVGDQINWIKFQAKKVQTVLTKISTGRFFQIPALRSLNWCNQIDRPIQ